VYCVQHMRQYVGEVLCTCHVPKRIMFCMNGQQWKLLVLFNVGSYLSKVGAEISCHFVLKYSSSYKILAHNKICVCVMTI